MMKIIKNNTKIIKQVYGISKGYVILNIISETLYNIVPVLNLLLLKVVVDLIIDGVGSSFSSIIWVIAIFGIVQTLFMVQRTYINNVYNPKIELIINRKMHDKMFAAIKNVDLSDIESSSFYNTYVKATSEIDTRIIAVCKTFFSSVSGMLAIISIIAVMVKLNPVFILFGCINVFLNLKLMTKKNKYSFELNMKKIPYTRVFDYIKRVFFLQDYAKEIRTFPTELLSEKAHESTDSQIDLVKTYAKPINTVDSLGMIIRMGISIIMLLYLSYDITKGRMAVGDFMAIVNGVSTLTMYLGIMLQMYPSMQQHSQYIENIDAVLTYKSNVEVSGSKKLNEFPEVYFNDVDFTYPSGTFSLKNISLDIKRGKKLAIVGYNGAGKSTFIKLLLKLYMPTKGNININNELNSLYDTKDMRKHIIPVFQDFEIYALSIAENILMRYVKDEEDIEKVENALKKAGLYEKVSNLPNGINTIVSTEFDDNGINLSGGEKQKLALARAIAMDSEILVLDEPSSSLDPESEHNLLETIFDITKNKSLVIITHRLAFANKMDEICFMEDGKIVERGTHSELIALEGKYYEFYNMQSNAYSMS
jgi:ATP-binding cassette subfamily B protein